LDADGAIVDGSGGTIDLEAAGALVITATGFVTARANGGLGDADEVDFGGQTITIAGVVDLTGGDAGGLLDVSADGAITVSGSITAQGFSDGSSGGEVDIE